MALLSVTQLVSHFSPSIWSIPGLGTSTSQEAKEYFSDMQRHRIPFKYAGPEDDEAITLVWMIFFCLCHLNHSKEHIAGHYNAGVWFLYFSTCFLGQAFSKKKVEERKEWLTNFMINRRQRREHNLPEVTSPQTWLGMICVSVGFHRVFGFFPGLPVWSGHQISLLQWFRQQRAGAFLQFWQWEVNPLPGGWYVELRLPCSALLLLLHNQFCWKWECFHLYLNLCVRSQTRSEEGAVLLL